MISLWFRWFDSDDLSNNLINTNFIIWKTLLIKFIKIDFWKIDQRVREMNSKNEFDKQIQKMS